MVKKNCLTQIERADLENEANPICKVINLSVNFVVATSCQVTPYYCLSLSRGSSTNHFTSESAFKLLKYNISERNITEETTLWETGWIDDIVNTGYSQEDLISDVLGLRIRFEMCTYIYNIYYN